MSVVLAKTTDLSREEWLRERQKGIGGSDAAAILGLNPWKSPIRVYMEKVGEIELEEEPSEAAYWGLRLEEVVADEFSKRTGMKVRRRNAILQHPQYPWMLANIDRMIVGRNEGLECKTASEYLKEEWKDDEVPAPYLIQMQHYMAVTNCEAWWIAVLVGGNKFIYKRIERDEEIIQHLIEAEREFWEEHVIPRVPPEFDGSEASSHLLYKLYPESQPGSKIELPNEAETLIEAIEQIDSEIQELETKKEEYQNKLKAMMGEHERGIVGDRVVTWKTIESRRIDTTRLKKERPDIYEKYLKVSKSRRFQIS